MAITPNCPSCGAAANGFVFTRGGVPVDTSQGFVELGAFQCSDLAACSISQIGNIPNTPTTAGTDLNGVGAPAASRLEADTNVRRFGWTPDTAVTLAAGDVLFFGVAADPATNQGNNDRIDIVRGWVQVTPV